jgi:hypothetical protein
MQGKSTTVEQKFSDHGTRNTCEEKRAQVLFRSTTRGYSVRRLATGILFPLICCTAQERCRFLCTPCEIIQYYVNTVVAKIIYQNTEWFQPQTSSKVDPKKIILLQMQMCKPH